MIDRDDLRAAVSAGVVTEAQAARLAALADSRKGARENLNAGDEPFELFKGFNEIFIVVGLVILGAGYLAVAGLSTELGQQNVFSRAILFAALGAVILWALSEYFIRRRRMVAPAITLSIFWAINAGIGLTAWLSEPFMVAQENLNSLPLPLAVTTLAVLAWWARFRVPFAMALIALGAFGVALMWVAARNGTPARIEEIFLLSADGGFAWITLGLGVVFFAIAMAFDMSDPHRVTRRAANGFWLHIIAAPALVNTLALTLLSGEGMNMLLALVLAVFALVAIIIDRRSFLIAAVGYCVTLAFTVFGGEGGAAVILTLGIVLLVLGAFWERIRAVLLRAFAGVLPLDRLPPSTAA
ncbi:hypothetical protein [Pseudaestuariivita atlantica]|uniref:Membrane protein n=1 Tax=Pseudaestuariivita atlantica TaxID=1317121 RepID=A0A0L1JQG6_9RHOB|nr:hypothetical protein [Pseudaestuariivita atlantica]KNG93663.1 membrane protein [Pseudaestuariivita atlantica]